MSRGLRISAASAAATVAIIAACAHAIGYFGVKEAGATEAEVMNPAVEAVHFSAPTVQEVLQSHDLLDSVRGLDPVACRLVGRALENRWGRGSVMPSWTLPGDGGLAAAGVADAAMRGEVPASEGPSLLDALASSDNCERRVAAQLLGRIDDAGIVSRLSALMTSGSARSTVGAALALGYGEWPDGVAPLTRALGGSDADLRATAAWALGRTESTDAIEPLTRAIGDTNVNVRANAIVALGWIESSRSVPALSVALTDDTPLIRVNAAWALGQIESPEAIPALTRVLGSDRDTEVRRAAAWALGRIE